MQLKKELTLKNIFTSKFIITIVFIILAICADFAVYNSPKIPSRKLFDDFPRTFEGWTSKDRGMGEAALKMLNPTDYIIRDYMTQDKSIFINLYIGYFDNQTEGSRIHSPKSCLNGGGWKILKNNEHQIELKGFPDGKITVNKALITKGKGVEKLVVFYWLQSRGRILTNEYLAKLYLIYDSIVKRRSDGSIVRLMTPVLENEQEIDAENRLNRFVQRIEPIITKYLPE